MSKKKYDEKVQKLFEVLEEQYKARNKFKLEDAISEIMSIPKAYGIEVVHSAVDSDNDDYYNVVIKWQDSYFSFDMESNSWDLETIDITSFKQVFPKTKTVEYFE